jgi:hypothetical protein
VFLDVLDDGAQLRSRQRAVGPTGRPRVELERLCCRALDHTRLHEDAQLIVPPLGRARIGLPAGTQMIDPAEGGICRVTPANRASHCCGGWLKFERTWRGCPHR